MFTKYAGAILYRLTDDGPQILLVHDDLGSAWRLPRGVVPRRERKREAEAAICSTGRTREEVRVIGEAGSLSRLFGIRRVPYYLLEASPDDDAREQQQWQPAANAVGLLTDTAAQNLLRRALADIDEEVALSRARKANNDPATEFLIKEFEHTAEALLRNEEDGEKRAMFFMTLAGATGTALAFLLGKDSALPPEARGRLLTGALSILLAVGYLTLLRIVQRNRASDRYKRALNRLRRYFVHDARRVFLAFDPYEPERRVPPSWASLGKGGWLETIALVEAVVAGILVARVVPCVSSDVQRMWFAGGTIIAWMLLMHDAARRYANDR
jgi:hypothetical protein